MLVLYAWEEIFKIYKTGKTKQIVQQTPSLPPFTPRNNRTASLQVLKMVWWYIAVACRNGEWGGGWGYNGATAPDILTSLSKVDIKQKTNVERQLCGAAVIKNQLVGSRHPPKSRGWPWAHNTARHWYRGSETVTVIKNLSHGTRDKTIGAQSTPTDDEGNRCWTSQSHTD